MYGNHFYNQTQRFQPMEPMYPVNQPFNNQFNSALQTPSNTGGLLGKSVDSLDVVKAMDIPLDGSTSYFPLTDGSAIVTKRLMSDGTSKTVVFKPVNESKENTTNFLVMEDLEDIINDINDMKDLKKDFKSIKKDVQEIKDKLKEE